MLVSPGSFHVEEQTVAASDALQPKQFPNVTMEARFHPFGGKLGSVKRPLATRKMKRDAARDSSTYPEDLYGSQ